MANFTPQQIEQFLQEFFDVVGTRQYIGARYVPIFGRAGEDTVTWDNYAPYEPLTVVMHQGISYVSRRYVPDGIQITDTDYWVETYRFNAQVEQYRREVLGFEDKIADRVPYPDGDTHPRFGTSGQVLSTLGDGSTMWSDPVVPSDEQAEQVITDWLDEHPEATTTVPDGGITTPKLANSSVTEPKVADGAISMAKLSAPLQETVTELSQGIDRITALEDTNYTNVSAFDHGFKGTSSMTRAEGSTMYAHAGDHIIVTDVPDTVRFYVSGVATSSHNTGWITGETTYDVVEDDRYRVIFGRIDNNPFTADFSELSGVHVEYRLGTDFLLESAVQGAVTESETMVSGTGNIIVYNGPEYPGYVDDHGNLIPASDNVTSVYTTTDYIPVAYDDVILYAQTCTHPAYAYLKITYFDKDKVFKHARIFSNATPQKESFTIKDTIHSASWSYVRLSYSLDAEGMVHNSIIKLTHDAGAQVYPTLFFATSGTIDLSSPITNLEFNAYVCDCTGYENFIITGTGGGNGRLWNFIDSEGTILSQAAESETCFAKVIRAPVNATHLVVNSSIYAPTQVFRMAYPIDRGVAMATKTHVPNVFERADIIGKPTIGFSIQNIQEDQQTACTKFGVFKNGDSYCVTYAQNMLHDNRDDPDFSETGTMEYHYRYFHVTNDTESDVSYGIVARKGSTYIDVNDTVQTMVGGVSYGSSVGDRLFFSTAYHNQAIGGAKDMKPCTCTVAVDANGVSFGVIHELRLWRNGVLGEFNITRIDKNNQWRHNYYTSCPPSYHDGSYHWCIPTLDGFAYLKSTDGITWNIAAWVDLPCQTRTEIACAHLSGSHILIAARMMSSVLEGNYTLVAVCDTVNNVIESQYKLTSTLSKVSLLRMGTGSTFMLFLNRGPSYRELSAFILEVIGTSIEFTHWFDLYQRGTYYTSVCESTMNSLHFEELYLVGGNGLITTHESAFIRLDFDTSKPRITSEIPFGIG